MSARRVTYHLEPREWFEASDPARPYVPEVFATDGFVHCTDSPDELVAVGNRYYRDDPRPYVVLTVDIDALTSPVRYEDEARLYPHVYGPLDRAAIAGVAPMARAANGTFLPMPGGDRGHTAAATSRSAASQSGLA